jgi:phage regulator Rha-like protein
MKKIRLTIKSQSQPKQEPKKDIVYKLTPKGCMLLALYKTEVDPEIAENFVELFWDSFEETLAECGYVIKDRNEN